MSFFAPLFTGLTNLDYEHSAVHLIRAEDVVSLFDIDSFVTENGSSSWQQSSRIYTEQHIWF